MGVGSQAVFKPGTVLFFGVVKGMSAGDVFQNLSMTQNFYRADMRKYSSGMLVRLRKIYSSGEYRFSAEAMFLRADILK